MNDGVVLDRRLAGPIAGGAVNSLGLRNRESLKDTRFGFRSREDDDTFKGRLIHHCGGLRIDGSQSDILPVK